MTCYTFHMYIHVKIFPKSKKEKIIKLKENTYKIYCKEKPKNNAVNRRILEILSIEFTTSTKNIHIISGHKRPQKMIHIKTPIF